jgi:NADPH:quinone reductase-like Zn-dependent oxidoreductase
MQQNPVVAGETMLVDIGDEALAAALAAVAKNNSVKVANAGDKATNVKLAVTSAVGTAFTNLAKQLANGGTVVRLNNSSPAAAEPLHSGVGAFIFQDKRIRGFDFHAMAQSNPVQCGEAVAAAASLMADGKVSLPAAKAFPQADFAKSIEAAQSGKNAIITISK